MLRRGLEAGLGLVLGLALMLVIFMPASARGLHSRPRLSSSSPASSQPIPAPPSPAPGEAPQPIGAPPSPAQTPVEARSLAPLGSQLTSLVAGSPGRVGLALEELDGDKPQAWSLNGDDVFVAASTYKLPVLEIEAEGMAEGRWKPDDSICYQDSDWEDGPYGDYQDGACYKRVELAWRIGHDSDNTAAHMLVRDLGGPQSLNSFASNHDARRSQFFDPNLTTAIDLTQLWAEEAQGRMGGSPAHKVLYPWLTGTAFEAEIPAGVPPTAVVVHKVGFIDTFHHDAALVQGASRTYVLVVLTDGLTVDAAAHLISTISNTVWRYETGHR